MSICSEIINILRFVRTHIKDELRNKKWEEFYAKKKREWSGKIK